MDLVAGETGPSLFPVDVEKVEVPVSIAEIGQGGRSLIQHHALLVALETKGIDLGVEWIIELLYKIILQYLHRVGPMGVMTGGTQPVPDWAVFKKCLPYLFCFLFVTTEAKGQLCRPFPQKILEI